MCDGKTLAENFIVYVSIGFLPRCILWSKKNYRLYFSRSMKKEIPKKYQFLIKKSTFQRLIPFGLKRC